jgi:hypothetical protein
VVRGEQVREVNLYKALINTEERGVRKHLLNIKEHSKASSKH